MTELAGHSGYRFRPLVADDAAVISTWRYDGPYALYDPHPARAEEIVAPEAEYHAVLSTDGELVGFCCFGSEARVPGVSEEPGTLDVGGGLRPDLTGIGLGAGFLRAVCAYGRALHAPAAFRVAIAAFNGRAQRVAHALGFEQTGLHSTDERDFVLMRRPNTP